jgi:hypothetical protein
MVRCMATRSKSRPIKKLVSARELPAAWPERERFAPDDRVVVWIELEDEELGRATSLQQLMDIIGERAKARGLTPGKLDRILHDG